MVPRCVSYLRVVDRPLKGRHDVRKAVRFEQRRVGDDDGPVHVERGDGFLAQVLGQFAQLELCPFALQRHSGFGHFDRGRLGQLVHFGRHGAGRVVDDGAAAEPLDGLLQDCLVVHFDALELEVALARVAPLVVLRQRVELLGVEVAHGAQVQRVEDDVGVIGVDVLFESVEVLRGEGAVFTLVAPLLPALRLWTIGRLRGRFVWSRGRIRFHARIRLRCQRCSHRPLFSMVV